MDKKNQIIETIDLNQIVTEVKEPLITYLTERNGQVKIVDALPSIKYDNYDWTMDLDNYIDL